MGDRLVQVEDVISVNNQFYVLATSSLADDRTRVLKYGDTFGVFNRLGDIESIGLGEHGIYYQGTRFLSRFVIKLSNAPPQLLRSTIRDDNAFLTIDAMNVDLSEDGQLTVPRGTLHMFRSKFLREATCYEHVRISNYSLEPAEISLSCEFHSDYHDIFEVRGVHRPRRGEILPQRQQADAVLLSYRGLDGVTRTTRLSFSVAPVRLTEGRARFEFALQPKEEWSLYITTSCETGNQHADTASFDDALRECTREFEGSRLRRTHIASADPRFNEWVARSAADMEMMIAGNPEKDYPYAGVPWFSTVFGRDGILTARECLWLAPWIAKGVLAYLAQTQATETNSERQAEPGKIIHEMRRGEMAALDEVPFGRYYGSVDATPLFVMLAGAYWERTGDRTFLKMIWPNIVAALDWIDRYGDIDRDGFVEYQARSPRGLIQQGWKDSHDAVFHSDGRIADHPIALCEVQGYVFAAKQAAAKIARAFGEEDFGDRMNRESEILRKKFEREFWDEELGTYMLALDGAKKKCRVKTSNPGHCLFSGIASAEHATRVADSLVGDELFSGWGVRTLGGNEVRYNPMAYHNGSVWPHDNAIAARGLARYGFHEKAMTVFSTLLEVTDFVELRRLPELFCGFHRRQRSEGPTMYPVACSPQAWSAGSLYLLLEAALGIEFHANDNSLHFTSQPLPEFLSGLTITGLQLNDSQVDVRISRDQGKTRPEIVRQTGNIRLHLDSVVSPKS
jgi:glycogen debranching enzyme